MAELATQIETQVVPPVADAAVAEPTSIADHATLHGPNRQQQTDDGVDPSGDLQGRRRSRSSQASPADAEKISEYTKRLRTAETELGFKIEKQDGESDRVYRLRRDAEIAEALRDARKPKPETPKAELVTAPTFNESEPTWDDVKDADDPVLALNRKLAAFDRRKEAFESQQAAHQQRVTADSEARSQKQIETATAFNGRLSAYLTKNPTHKQVMESVDTLGPIPPALSWAFIEDDKGPELMYYFANHPDDLAEMILLSNSAEVTEQSIALFRRRLHARAQAVTTGSAAVVPTQVFAPRPPNPVRTVPTKTAEEVSGDVTSIKDHAKRFAPKSHRR